MSSIFNVLFSKHLTVPLKTTILDPRVDNMFVLMRIFSILIAISFFLFGLRGWSQPTLTIVSSNMWMTPPTYPSKTFPTYCDNMAYDFTYDKAFQYHNTTCVNTPSSLNFIKAVAPDSFFVSTFIQTFDTNACPGEDTMTRTTTPAQICSYTSSSGNGQQQVRNQQVRNGYVLDVDEYLISARTHVNVAQLGFDSRRDTIQYIAVLPNGTHYELTSLDLSVGQWVELFNIGLDDSNMEAALTTSVGVPKNRLAGVLLNVEVEVTNVRSRWDFPGDIVVLWHLSAVPSWQRVNLADERVSVQTDDGMTTIIRSTHAYGLKWVSFQNDLRRCTCWTPVPV